MGYIDGEDRKQTLLFPEVLGDYITEENAVRFIDVFTGHTEFHRSWAGNPGKDAPASVSDETVLRSAQQGGRAVLPGSRPIQPASCNSNPLYIIPACPQS
jgi:hypothetical protein